MDSSSTKKTFLKGALVLTIATFFVKIAGLGFTMVIQRQLDDGGMGVFYNAYNIYNMFAVLASAGLPVAVSRMISETLVSGNRDEARKIYRVSIRLFTAIGAVLASVMFLFSDILAAEVLKNADAGLSIKVLALTAFCAFVMSALRGYFQGQSQMRPTAVSQVIEAFTKLALGVALAAIVMKVNGSDRNGSAAAITGVSVGAVIAVIYLLIEKKRYDKKIVITEGMPVRSSGQIVKALFKIAIPVSLGASVMSIVNVIDDIVIMNVLQGGIHAGPLNIAGLAYTYDYAKILNGIFGNAKKIFNLPSAFIVPFTVSILPVLTAAFTARDREGVKTSLVTCFKYSMMLALPAGIGMIVVAEPIYSILYKTEQPELGAQMLAIFGLAVILYAVVSITGSILQAFGKVNLPLISLVVGGVVKCILTTVFVSTPGIEIKGAPIATCICYVVMITMNLIFLRKFMKGSWPGILVSFAKTVAAAAVMGVFAYLPYRLLSGPAGLSSKISGIIAIVVAVVVYVALLLLFRVVTIGELKSVLKRKKPASAEPHDGSDADKDVTETKKPEPDDTEPEKETEDHI